MKCEWANYKDVLALGGFDITHHLVMYFLKPIEQGLDVKFTGGIHRGCLRVQAATKGNIQYDPGSARQTHRRARAWERRHSFLPIAFSAPTASIPSKEITWRVFPAGELGLALDKGEVDAVADSEPIGSLLLAEGKVRNIADQATDAPYKDEYCCAVIVNGKFLADESESRRRRDARLAESREMGGDQSGRRRAIFRSRKNISPPIRS